jgi:DNA-binding CsgD family transcriptional regulator
MRKAWLLALFFSWIYLFPYFGIFLSDFASLTHYPVNWLAYLFILSHALGYLCGASFVKRLSSSRNLMLFSLSATVVINTALWVFPEIMLLPGLALAGFISSFFVLGWSHLYSTGETSERAWIIIHMAVRSHLLTLIILIVDAYLGIEFKLIFILAPLLIALGLITLPQRRPAEYPLITPLFIRRVPLKFFLIFCIFIATIKLTAGFIYSIIYMSYPVMVHYPEILSYFEFLPHVLVLLIFLRYYERLNKVYLALAGATLLGFAYIGFALLGNTLHGFLITTILIEAAFASINVFTWLLLGDLSTKYGRPHWFFGIGLSVNTGITVLGGIVGDTILISAAKPGFSTSLIAAGLIIISLLIILWLRENANYNLAGFSESGSLRGPGYLAGNLVDIFDQVELTEREKEIITLMLEGKTNRAIAEELFITENTIKSHCRNIYAKFNVRNKSELLVEFADKG